MNENVHELRLILENELKAYTELVGIAQKMSDAIKASEIARVGQLAECFDTIAARIEELEEDRLHSCDTLSKELGFERRPANLGTFMAKLPKEDTGKINVVRAELKEKIVELAKINNANKIMMEASLDAFETTVSLITKARPKYRGYKQTGKEDDEMVALHAFNRVA